MAITCMSAPVSAAGDAAHPGTLYQGSGARRDAARRLPVLDLARRARCAALTASVPSQPRIARRELWIAGNVSPRARQEFEAMGWTVYEQVSAQLNPPA